LIKADRKEYPLSGNDLRLFYTLSELSGRPNYKSAADARLKWIMENVRQIRGVERTWMLWDRCFEVAPAESRIVASDSATLRSLAAAYHYTKNAEFLKRIESTFIPGESPVEQISAAIDAWGVSGRLPQPLATRLREFARSQDDAFLARPDPLKSNRWQSINGEPLTAGLAMLCVSRYENCGDIRYRQLIHTAADFYLTTPPPNDTEINPRTFGHIISLELAAWRSAAKQEYLDSARNFADLAIKRFWSEGKPLPSAADRSDTLVLSLLELHLSVLHITAVRCPPNTIDR